jgi:hypothetical protein
MRKIMSRTFLALLVAYGAATTPTVHAAVIWAEPTDTSVDPGNGICSLAEAIRNANADADSSGGDCAAGSGPDVIELEPDAAYILTASLESISTEITINGHMAIIERDQQAPSFGIFRVTYQRGDLTLNDLTIRNGRASYGAGIYSDRSRLLTLNNCIVTGNSADLPPGQGGGVFAFNATVFVNDSDISGNSARVAAGIFSSNAVFNNTTISNNTAIDEAGGIWGSTVWLNNSTVSGNVAGYGAGVYGREIFLTNSTVSGNVANRFGGGGLYLTGAQSILSNTTVADNIATSAGGNAIVVTRFATAVLRNSILMSQSPLPNCLSYGGTITSHGYNMNSDGTCNLTQWTDTPNTDSLMGPLANNGGATQTHALLPGSPAIDAGSCIDQGGNPVVIDQRGVGRPQGAGCDMGAFELESSNAPPELTCNDVITGNDPERCSATLQCEDVAYCSDPDGDQVSQTCDNMGPLPVGTTEVTVECSDGQQVTSSICAVTVEDIESPELAVKLNPDTLWPPNHHMIDVEATVIASDNCDALTLALVSLTSNEADDAQGVGDGRTIADILPGADDFHFHLRAERAGTGCGRIYTAVYTATDGAGNAASEAGFAVVPHDQRGMQSSTKLRRLKKQ